MSESLSSAAQNPFPGADKTEWSSRFAQALSDHSGIPLDYCYQVAPYVVRPKSYLRARSGGHILRSEVLSKNSSGQEILRVEVHGFAGAPMEYNERIHTYFASPAQPNVDPNQVLPQLFTGEGLSAQPAPYLKPKAITREHLAALLDTTTSALSTANRPRTYALDKDLAVHGQQTPGLHAVMARTVLGEDGQQSTVVDLVAIGGNNRAQARLSLFELSAKDIILNGVDSNLVFAKDKPSVGLYSTDSRYWVPKFANLLRDAWNDSEHKFHENAVASAKVATVLMDLIVGSDDVKSFHTSVFAPNRIDHRRPPLDYGAADKAIADLKALLLEYAAADPALMPDAKRRWLSGTGTDPDLKPGESVVDARDRRDRALFGLLFPDEKVHADIVRRSLGEPSRSSLTLKDVQWRLALFSAGASDAYPSRWNPRVLNGLVTVAMVKKGGADLPVSGQGWREDLTAITTKSLSGRDAMADFVVVRGMHWLASFGLVDADRGSVSGQRTEEGEQRVRRTMTSVRDALAYEPGRAVGLFNEIYLAFEEGRTPRQIDEAGKPIEDTTATSNWFNVTFPKGTRLQRSNESVAGLNLAPDPTPTPERTPAQKAAALRADIHQPCESIATALHKMVEYLRNLNEAARGAGEKPLDESGGSTLSEQLLAAQSDVEGLLVLVPRLLREPVDSSKFPTHCAALFGVPADDEDAERMEEFV